MPQIAERQFAHSQYGNAETTHHVERGSSYLTPIGFQKSNDNKS